jgi:hypothetical protein
MVLGLQKMIKSMKILMKKLITNSLFKLKCMIDNSSFKGLLLNFINKQMNKILKTQNFKK